MDEINKIFSDNLNYWLERRGKTQNDLVIELDMAKSTVSEWCSGKKIPRTDKLVMISLYLMIELTDLLEVKDKKENIYNDIMYRIKESSDFRQLVEDIFRLNREDYEYVKKTVNILKKED